jgi:DNA-binding XRE family transcriptional regulator
MSQAVLAGVLNVSARTVQSWEQGERKPSYSALRIIQLLREHPEAVCEAAGLRSPRNGRRWESGNAGNAEKNSYANPAKGRKR